MLLADQLMDAPYELSIAIKRQIFIVDDDESIRRALKLLLGTYGYNVTAFSSSEEFFKAVPHSTPGCLILDVHMPGLNGWETHQKLLKAGSTRPVIIITANNSAGPRDRALKAGAVGFLQKPFNDQELVEIVSKCC